MKHIEERTPEERPALPEQPIDQAEKRFGPPVVDERNASVELRETPDVDDYHGDYRNLSHSMIQQFRESRTVFDLVFNKGEKAPKQSTKPMEIGEIIHEFCLKRTPVKKFVRKYPELWKHPTETYQRAGKVSVPTYYHGEETVEDEITYKKGDQKIVKLYQDRPLIDFYVTPNGEKIHYKAENGSQTKRYREWVGTKEKGIHYFLGQHSYDQTLEAISAMINTEDLWYWINSEGTIREEMIYWRDLKTGQDCRCAIDFHREFQDFVLCFDLKCTVWTDPYDFVYQYWDKGKKWLQMEHYGRGLYAKYKKPVFWMYIAACPTSTSTGHYPVACHAGGTDQNWPFSNAYDDLMKTIAECYESNDWREWYTKPTAEYGMVNQLQPRIYANELPGINTQAKQQLA